MRVHRSRYATGTEADGGDVNSRKYTLDNAARSIELQEKHCGDADITLLTSWVKRPSVTASITKINLLGNPLGASGVAAIIALFDEIPSISTLYAHPFCNHSLVQNNTLYNRMEEVSSR